MSINSSPFHNQSKDNINLKYISQDYHFPDQQREMMNNPMSNSMHLYNQFHSSLSNSKDDMNSQFMPILSNKEKRNEIELNMLIKKSESNSSFEIMKISLIKLFEKQSRLIIQVTNPNDPLFLYSLELSELEYQQLKNEQSLLVDFQNFPDFIVQMIDCCKKDNNDKFTCVFNTGGQGENNFGSNSLGILSVEEKTQYRKLSHIVLKLKAANDTTLKKYLSDLSKEYKDKYETLFQNYNDLNQKFDMFQKDYAILKENMLKMENQHKAYTDNLINEKNKEINSIKENNFIETKKQLESMESEKNKIISDLENKISQLQGTLNDTTKNKTQLEEHKLKLEINQKDLEGKFAISSKELSVYKSQITTLRQENSDLNQKCLNSEKLLTEANFKNESLSQQLEEKNKSFENMKQLVDSLNTQRDSNEDTIKSLKASNNKLESKLQLSIKEINKANDIIQRLQNEIKNQKSKVKSTKNELSTQEQLINQKQMLLDEQSKTIKEIKRENEEKDQEIMGLKNQINNYTNKLNENEKLIEENKQMILYLNKNINENSNNPFRSRFNYTSVDVNNPMNNGSFGLGINTSNEISNNLKNLNNNNQYMGKTINSINLNSNLDSNSNINKNLNINNLTKYNNNIGYSGNENENNFGIQSQTSNKQTGNYFQNSLSSNTSGMIMPETNFTGYQFNDKVSGIANKYLNNNNEGLGLGSGGSLLLHKYGGSVTNSMSVHNNDNNINEKYGMSGAKSADNNLEEEFPRTLAQPQSQIIRK
jgi:spindle assembly abnormal protein 6